MTEVDDRWVELPAVHDPIVRTRFDKKKLLRMRGTESETRVAGAEHIWCPTRFPFFRVNRLPQDSRSCLTPLYDPLKLRCSKEGLSTDVG